MGISHMITSGGLQQDNAVAVGEQTGLTGNAWGSTVAQIPADGL